MRSFLIVILFSIALQLFSQEETARYNYLLINPFNAGINQVALTWEKRNDRNGYNLTAGIVYHRTEKAIQGFGIIPSNYIIINTFYAYDGMLLYPGYNRYLKKNPDSWIGVRGVFKYMHHDSLDLTWQWNDGESFTRRVQSDRLYVAGAEFLFGVKTDFAKHFFYEIFAGAGFRFKFHNITVYDSYLDIDPSSHQDPSYPFNEKYRLFRPTIHLGINLGLKI
jgi:hypothetical protein